MKGNFCRVTCSIRCTVEKHASTEHYSYIYIVDPVKDVSKNSALYENVEHPLYSRGHYFGYTFDHFFPDQYNDSLEKRMSRHYMYIRCDSYVFF